MIGYTLSPLRYRLGMKRLGWGHCPSCYSDPPLKRCPICHGEPLTDSNRAAITQAWAEACGHVDEAATGGS